eukprot:UN31901
MSFWKTLDRRIFCHLPATFTKTIVHLGISLKRAFLIYAIKKKQPSVVKLFFKTFGDEFSLTENLPYWQDWFAIPYISDPSTHEIFSSYFKKEWMSKFAISLKNFFRKAFSELSPPKLLAINIWREERNQLRKEVATLCKQLETAKLRIRSLEKVNLDLLEGETGYTPTHVHTNTPGKRTPKATTKGGPIEHHSSEGESESEGPTPGKPKFDSLIPTLNSDKQNFRIQSQQTFCTSGHITNCVVSEKGSRLAFAVEKKKTYNTSYSVEVWELSEIPANLKIFPVGKSPVQCLTFGKTSSQLFICTDKITLWDVDTGRTKFSVVGVKDFPRMKVITCSNSIFALSSAKKQPGNDAKGMLSIWHLNGLMSVKSQQPLPVEINSIEFNHNNKLLICGCDDGTIRIYDVRQLTRLDKWKAHDTRILSMHLNNVSNSVVSISSDWKVRHWNISSTKKDPQREWILQTNTDNPLYIWEYERAQMRSIGSPAEWVAFSESQSMNIE